VVEGLAFPSLIRSYSRNSRPTGFPIPAITRDDGDHGDPPLFSDLDSLAIPAILAIVSLPFSSVFLCVLCGKRFFLV
jgi:hypothetical protein